MKCSSAHEAVSVIKSGHNIFIHTAAAAPIPLIEALTARADELSNISIYHMHTEGPAPYTEAEYVGTFEVNSLFIGANCRSSVNEGRTSFIPSFLSEIPVMIRQGVIPVDVALIQVSSPDRHGYCSLGISVDATKAAVDVAQFTIAQVNPRMPRTHGDGLIHISKFSVFVEIENELPELSLHNPTPEEQKIGEFISTLIEDGSTLQTGIGAIPNAVLSCLGNHKDLGIHTEMFSDGVLQLVEKGVVNNKFKTKHKDVIVSSFLLGTRRLYDFVDDNPMVRMLDVAYVNDSRIIRQLPKMISINSAIELDLTGQVCSDSIGTRMYSGVGGQMDFIRGASLSKGGKPMIALTSITRHGESKIAAILKPGAGVVTTRAHVQYVVTEYGIVNLYGKNLHQRAKLLISIAHPNHREALERAAFERFKRL
ncbi:acetyl-CoA hydrolase/transferase family protein [Roseivirga echinicomitans]|uniref:4-hydroxybutyrate CoA-transferase n=1 Tax=Roseivirga echinicomitans TaxID=296218 RepID=A0A150XUQ7_9BACT|nr:acetyl-CoA hydrolase/transferase C-terminal domain-containing protein [Roseivirga echinicomitans]KYG82453.1 4-hydroxybutyrate CoA-transferase [Roseivirga echinicomitans]